MPAQLPAWQNLTQTKTCQAELARHRRKEQTVEQRLDKAIRTKIAACEQVLDAEQARFQAEQAAAAAERIVADAKQAWHAAEIETTQGIKIVEEAVANVNVDGKQDNSFPAVTTSSQKAVQRAFDKTLKVLESSAGATEAEQTAHEALLAAASASTNDTLAAKTFERAETVYEKAHAKAQDARDSVSEALGTLQESGNAFVDGFYAANGQLASTVRTTQQTTKSAFRTLCKVWQRAKLMRDSQAKAMAGHLRAMRRVAATVAAHGNAANRQSAAESEPAPAEAPIQLTTSRSKKKKDCKC